MPKIISQKLIVGMEIHVELSTDRKMFAGAPNPAGAARSDAVHEPNALVDEVVLALPGALPVLNRAAIEQSIRVGLVLGCTIAERTKWDRKSYFYPDLPKAYQISQYDMPLCAGGRWVLTGEGREADAEERVIRITRAHLEEDAGKLLHEAPGGVRIDHSIVDLNRAGAPLLEIVTEPDFRSAEECVRFATELREACRWIGATVGDLQKGHMRFEPNINCVLELNDGRLVRTPVVEVKNLNSFRALKGAIEYEAAHQGERWLEDGREMGPGMKITRGWDDVREVTTPQREKEDAHDYRYFPDPDLPTVTVERAWVDRLRAALPVMPAELGARYRAEIGLNEKSVSALLAERGTHDLFAQAVAALTSRGMSFSSAGKATANLVLQAGLRLGNERGVTVDRLGVDANRLAELVELREGGEVSANAAELIFEVMCDEPSAQAGALADRLGLRQVRDDAALDAWCREVIGDPANTKSVEDVRAGKQQAIGRLIGGVMQRSGGAADAKSARERLLAMLADGTSES